MPDHIAHGHHQDDEEVTSGILKGKYADFVAAGGLLIDAINILAGKFAELEPVYQQSNYYTGN